MQLQIVDIIQETSAAKTFVLQPLDNSVFQYKPGQFITLVFNTKFGEKRRSYSFSSSPYWNELPSITIKRVENGEFSRLLTSRAKTGDILHSSGVSGLFQLSGDIDATGQFFFFAGGSGITPCYSLIKTILITTEKPVVLVYSNKQKADAIFYEQLLLLQQQFPWQLKIHFLFSINSDVHYGRLSNWLVKELLEKYLVAEKGNAFFYLCGPFDYMQMITITLLSEGVPRFNIRKENFNDLPRLIKPIPPDLSAHKVIIHFENKVYPVIVQYPQTILAAARAAKISLPYSCEAGRCGSCVATCVKGKTWMAYNEVLMDEEIERGRILCCQSYPTEGDATIIVE